MIISVIIPCYRSEKTIRKVVDEIKSEFEKQNKYGYEIILVNDGSPDRTFCAIREICASDKNIIGVNLSRNFGQASAKMTGIRYASGDIVVYMDDDGQHPAKGIFKLAEKVLEGYDVVYAHFQHKQHSWFKRITSDINKRVSVWAGISQKGVFSSSFLAYSKFVSEALKKYDSPFVSMGGYIMRITEKFANVEIEHRKRIEGESGYTLKKLLRLWMNSFTNFTIIPLRIASFTGIICSILGFLFGGFVIIRKLIVPSIAAGYSSLIAVLLFIGGIIMIMLGLLGEYVGRIYMTISGAPQYYVREIINSPEKTYIKEMSYEGNRSGRG